MTFCMNAKMFCQLSSLMSGAESTRNPISRARHCARKDKLSRLPYPFIKFLRYVWRLICLNGSTGFDRGSLAGDFGNHPVDIDVVKLTWRTSHDSSCPGAIDFASVSLHTPTILSITLQQFKISISTTLRNV